METETLYSQWETPDILQGWSKFANDHIRLHFPDSHVVVENVMKGLFYHVQKHSPSGIIELKDIRDVSELLDDGSFQVS